jgi:hypothetical protein
LRFYGRTDSMPEINDKHEDKQTESRDNHGPIHGNP